MKKIFSTKAMLIVLFGIVLSNCNDSNVDEPPFDINENLACYNKTEWDSQLIKNKLIGTWNWVYTQSYSSPDNGINTEPSNINIRFDNDSILTFIENEKTKFTTRWNVVSKENSYFEIDTDSTINHIFGRIIICDDHLLFNGSYIDLSDNYFNKIKIGIQ
ncbi:MAG: hypothetical protein ACERKD_00825 [Prolixibacteraceae bacterium]